MDLDNLPAEGDSWATYFPSRKVYGNIITGFPQLGIQYNSVDDSIHYAHRGAAGTSYNWDSLAVQLVQTQVNTSTAIKNMEIYQGDPGAVTIANNGVLPNDRFNLYTKKITLAGGAAANQELLAAAAGKNGVIQWIAINTDTGATTYTCTIHENGGVAMARTFAVSTAIDNAGVHRVGDKIHLNMVNTDANSGTEIDVAGGAGAEIIWVSYLAKTTTTF